MFTRDTIHEYLEKYNLGSVRFTKLADYVDEQTGVHYLLVYDENSLNSLCPRYNADGTLMVEEKK